MFSIPDSVESITADLACFEISHAYNKPRDEGLRSGRPDPIRWRDYYSARYALSWGVVPIEFAHIVIDKVFIELIRTRLTLQRRSERPHSSYQVRQLGVGPARPSVKSNK